MLVLRFIDIQLHQDPSVQRTCIVLKVVTIVVYVTRYITFVSCYNPWPGRSPVTFANH